jgi:hypothetical protein
MKNAEAHYAPLNSPGITAPLYTSYEITEITEGFITDADDAILRTNVFKPGHRKTILMPESWYQDQYLGEELREGIIIYLGSGYFKFAIRVSNICTLNKS